MHQSRLTRTVCLVALAALWPAAGWGDFDVRDFGAVGDGQALDTAAIQRAVDACAARGGGTVTLPPGVYRSGTVRLADGVRLHLDHGATLLGSGDLADYEPPEELPFAIDAVEETRTFRHALIRGEGVAHVAVTGSGVIDANFSQRGGPKPIAFKQCRFVDIRGLRMVNAPNYTVSLLGCDDVTIDGLTILNGYADGIVLDSCRNVRVSNCRIESRDDALCLKASFSLGEPRATENITVTNCVLSSVCNGFKLGTESMGGFRRIALTNSVITGFSDNRPAISGIALQSVDGAVLEDVVVSNVTMVDVRAPIFIRLGNRGLDRGAPVAGRLRDVSISNITAKRASLACSVTGIPSHSVERVTLSDIRIDFYGGNPRLGEGERVPEMMRAYPEAPMFGPMPAYGLYVRHVRGLSLRNLRFTYPDEFWRLTTDDYREIQWPGGDATPSHAEPADAGHALYGENVDGLRIDGFHARPSRDGTPLAHFEGVRDYCPGPCDTGLPPPAPAP